MGKSAEFEQSATSASGMESEPSLACVGVPYLWRLVWTQCPGYDVLRGSDRAGSETGGQSNHQPDGQADSRSQADAQHWIITCWCIPSDRWTSRQSVTGRRTALDNNVLVYTIRQMDEQTVGHRQTHSTG